MHIKFATPQLWPLAGPGSASSWGASHCWFYYHCNTLLTQYDRFWQDKCDTKMLSVEFGWAVLPRHTAPPAIAHTSLIMSFSVVQPAAVPHELPVTGWCLTLLADTIVSSQLSYQPRPAPCTCSADSPRGSSTLCPHILHIKIKV